MPAGHGENDMACTVTIDGSIFRDTMRPMHRKFFRKAWRGPRPVAKIQAEIMQVLGRFNVGQVDTSTHYDLWLSLCDALETALTPLREERYLAEINAARIRDGGIRVA